MGLQNFGLLCFHFLSWPMLALAYPLCASIRAIETGSKYHMRKLVTYWTVLSILSLFEHTLRVMKWVPFVALHKTELGAKLHCILSQFTRALYAQKQLSIHIKAKEQTTEQGTEETKLRFLVEMEHMLQFSWLGCRSKGQLTT
ncbi:PREDICTED: HVA22-like protein e isoform X7 [Ipomoea nil]|uniref:HVA22-like protein e isoform X7 n=1 Tax=Ipomoea nil TaxID=35883 RepID=UPI000901DE18|nr:PREDICTED: HVA22-like protein e isoform X7 [Ipomoea nil]